MSVAAKKHHIEIKVGAKRERLYRVPRAKAKSVEQLLSEYLVKSTELIPADKVFAELDQKYSKAGNILVGLRLREKLTQLQLAKKIGTSQPVIAAIENGHRKIGKTLAEKLARVFKTDFRLFVAR